MKFFKKIQIVLAILVLAIANLTFLPKTFAGTLTQSSVLETGGASSVNPMIASDAQSLAVEFKTVASGATTASINFGSWGGTVNGTQSITSTGCTNYFPSATALPGGSLAASGSGSTISITGITSLSATTLYCVLLTSTSAVTNPGAGVYPVILTVGSDSQTDAIDVLSSGANAYSITGSVGPTFTMALSGGGTDTFPSNLTSGGVTVSNGITTTINTNAASGWFVWAEDSQAGLHSTSASKLIPTVPTGANQTMNSGTYGPGHEYYGLGVSVDNTANYAYGGGTTGGGLSTSTFNEIATSASAANGVTFVTHELANISSTTPPATDYTDTITLIGAGSF